MKRKIIWILGIVLVLLCILLLLNRIGTHNGVTDAQVSEALPGDQIIPDPWISIDRAAVLPVPAAEAWPWVVQLGKDRAGWYAPLWLENVLKEHAASSTLPQYQNLSVGQVVPDWGGGSLKVIDIVPGSHVVYGSLRGSSTTVATSTDYAFTWALVLENDTPTSTTFHLRLRLKKPAPGTASYIPPSLPGVIDYATDIVMFAGLKERLSH